MTELYKFSSAEDRKASLRRLDRISAEMWRIIRATHVIVAGKAGEVATWGTDEEGNPQPVLDDKPKIEAARTLIQVEARRAKLLGLDAPTRHEELTLDVLDAEIERLSAALGDEGRRIVNECGYRTEEPPRPG